MTLLSDLGWSSLKTNFVVDFFFLSFFFPLDYFSARVVP